MTHSQSASRLPGNLSRRGRGLLAAALLALACLAAPRPAQALFHLATIDEVVTSYGGDPNVQFVEIRMEAGIQMFVTNSVLAAFDASGNYIEDVLLVPGDVAISNVDVRWLMATAEFTAASGLTPDFVMPAGLPTQGGMVCWGAPGEFLPPDPGSWNHEDPANYTDCVAYGSYSGPSNIFVGTPTPLNANGHSLQRIGDTNDNASDFACGDPSTPTINDGSSVSLPATIPCSGQPPINDPIPAAIPTGNVAVSLDTVATDLTAPNWGTHPGDASGRLFVTDQPGQIQAIDLGTQVKTLFLDVSDRLVDLGIGGPNTFDERGLLGLAFHPDYSSNGLLYTYTSEPVDGPADFPLADATPNHQSVVTEWRVNAPADLGAVVDPSSARRLLRIDEPQFNHDGGAVTFGPDGMLYISLGDGGGADDQGAGHSPNGNGQDTSNVLGTILRIDVDGSDSANGQYGVPADNPFVGQDGIDEIFAYGLRNPFRISFDSLAGDLYIADVGQNDIEEIDICVAGGNYGWNLKEGSFFFVPNGDDPGFVTDLNPGVPPGLIDPIAEYDHDEGIAVIGGFVYRGTRIPELAGRYVFGDFAGRLFFLDENDQVVEFDLVDPPALNRALDGFGQDADGEIYVLANSTGVPFGDTGVVLQLVSALQPEIKAFRAPGTVRLRNTSTDGGGSTRTKRLTVVARLPSGAPVAGTESATVELTGSGGQGFAFSADPQTGELKAGGGGTQFKFEVPFDVSGCDATPVPDGEASTGAIEFTAEVTLDQRQSVATQSIVVNMLCKP